MLSGSFLIAFKKAFAEPVGSLLLKPRSQLQYVSNEVVTGNPLSYCSNAIITILNAPDEYIKRTITEQPLTFN